MLPPHLCLFVLIRADLMKKQNIEDPVDTVFDSATCDLCVLQQFLNVLLI